MFGLIFVNTQALSFVVNQFYQADSLIILFWGRIFELAMVSTIHVNLENFETPDTFFILYITILAGSISFIGMLCYIQGYKTSNIALGTLICNIDLPLSVIFSWLILNTSINYYQIIGIVIVFFTVSIYQYMKIRFDRLKVMDNLETDKKLLIEDGMI